MITFSDLGNRATPPTIARLMAMALENPKLLSLAAGFTDNSSLPCAEVREISRNLLNPECDPEVLQYGTNQGRPGLRARLRERFDAADKRPFVDDAGSSVLVTNGSQQALYLAMQVLGNPGDIVLVDRPSYFVFLEMLVGLGLRPVSIPTTEEGSVDFPAFDALLSKLVSQGERERIKAIYFVSYFSNPSSRSLGLGEKRGLAVTLKKYQLQITVLEDAAYRELHYKSECPVPSVFGLPEWDVFPKLYLSTLTKPFSTGLKVGYGICSDGTWLGKMLCVKGHHDFGSANFNQAILERALVSGAYDAQLAVLRPVYEAKRDALNEALDSSGLRAAGWSWGMPEGGLYLWLRGPKGLDTGLDSDFCHACIQAGVLYVPGELCFGDDPQRDTLRLSFGVLSPALLRDAALRFSTVALEFSPKASLV